jgi:hypothetical protein
VKRIAILIIPIGVAAALVAKRSGPCAGRRDFGERIAAMPDSAPPKWIYNNTALRANTARILELLERRTAGATAEVPASAPPEV